MTDLVNDPSPPRIRQLIAALLVAMAVLGVWDLATDAPRVWRGSHAFVEVGFIVLALASAVVLGRRWQDAERKLEGIRQALDARREERDVWKARAQTALRGLGEALDAQFDAWTLTPAEKETALFLLKGYSHKETASLTHRSERTVRQHAVSVYRKSGLAGRAELAAFFFEDMLLPQADRPTAPEP